MKIRTTAQISLEAIAGEFLRQSVGEWKSQRRYYTLNNETEPEEVVSIIRVNHLQPHCPQLINLARLHQLEDDTSLVCGSEVTWESNYVSNSKKPSQGSTIFGILGGILYRDRGFATSKPVTAIYQFTNPQTMVLRTEYSGSVFEEEIKLIGQSYRTRQTIISRNNEELMIGQYLEKRIS